jgi:hypothetical protein
MITLRLTPEQISTLSNVLNFCDDSAEFDAEAMEDEETYQETKDNIDAILEMITKKTGG